MSSDRKACIDCGETKPVSEFHRDAAKSDGLRNYCKSCNRARVNKWERENRGKRREQVRRYHARHPHTVKAREARNRDTAKRKARDAVNNAIKSGSLIKPEHCEDCGESVPSHRLHGHHDDYAKPLDVRWLCSVCHKAAHPQGADRRVV